MALTQTNFTPLHSQKAQDSNSNQQSSGGAGSPCLMPRQTEGFRRDSEADISLFALVWAKN